MAQRNLRARDSVEESNPLLAVPPPPQRGQARKAEAEEQKAIWLRNLRDRIAKRARSAIARVCQVCIDEGVRGRVAVYESGGYLSSIPAATQEGRRSSHANKRVIGTIEYKPWGEGKWRKTSIYSSRGQCGHIPICCAGHHRSERKFTDKDSGLTDVGPGGHDP